MFETIHWSVYTKASTKQKVMKVFSQLEISFGLELMLLSCEPYAKGDQKFSFTFTSPLNQNNLAQAVLNTLLTARKLGSNWSINGPYSNNRGAWNFRGICTNPTFTGVDWIMFTVDNEKTYSDLT